MNKCYIDIVTNIEIIKDRLIDLSTAHTWFVDDNYTSSELKNSEQAQKYSYAYREHRIHCEHMLLLLDLHIEDLTETIKLLHRFEQQKNIPIVEATTIEA